MGANLQQTWLIPEWMAHYIPCTSPFRVSAVGQPRPKMTNEMSLPGNEQNRQPYTKAVDQINSIITLSCDLSISQTQWNDDKTL
jgi:hypothetical protein